MANRKSASKQATGGASRSLNPQLANRNRFASIGNPGNTSSKPLTSPNQSSRSKVQTRTAPKPPQPQVAANHSSNGTKSQGTSNRAPRSQGANDGRASQDRSMHQVALAKRTGNGPNKNPQKVQGHTPVPQPKISLKPQAPKLTHSQPVTGGRSWAPKSVLSPPLRPGNAQPSLFSGVYRNKAGQKFQSLMCKAHSHITQESSNKEGHRNNLLKPTMNNRSVSALSHTKNVIPPPAKALPSISGGSKGTGYRSSNLMNGSGPKHSSSNRSHQVNMLVKQSPATKKPMPSPNKVKWLVISNHATDRTQKSSKYQSTRGSSTVKTPKSTSVPRRKEFQVRSNSSKVLSRSPTKTTTRKSLLRQHSPTIIWQRFSSPKVVSAYSTLTAAPLPLPPKNELQNKVACKTIAQNPDLFKIVSPIKVYVFKKYLKDHPNQRFVKSVVYALQNGFWPYADTTDPTLPTTYDGSRQRKPTTNKNKVKFIRQQRDEEMEFKRWSKPFGEKLLRGMHSSPIAAIPKSTPGQYRLIIDQSYGPHALNSTIRKSQVKVKLDNIHDLSAALLAVRKKHPKRKLCLFKSDVKSAYRQLPIHPLWQIKQVVTVDGQCHVDRCNTFGNRGGGWNWDSVASLVNWIGTEKKKIPDLLGYVDDNFGWEFEGNMKYYKPYKKHFPAKQTRLLELWDELGIPHDKDKQLYGPSLPIIGYEVDANAMTVKVPNEKKAKVIRLLRNYAHEGKSYTLKELQSVAGSTSAVLSLYPCLRSGLRGLFDEMAGKKGPSTKLMVTKPVAHSLSKLADYLGHARPVPIQQMK